MGIVTENDIVVIYTVVEDNAKMTVIWLKKFARDPFMLFFMMVSSHWIFDQFNED